MLRVYGITYDHTTNYGSCFQAYALQTAVEKIKVGRENCRYELIPIKTCSDWPGKRFSLVRLVLDLHYKQFEPFEREYMKFAACDHIEEFGSLNKNADAFICGSDVIWNTDFNFNLGAFYLDFAEKYCFSYAASFGKSGIKKSDVLTTRLSHLNSISVRDRSSANIVESCIGKAPEVVVDPILLLSRRQWDEIVNERVYGSQHYIFVYATHLNENIRSFIGALRRKTGLKVINAAWGPKQTLQLGMIQIHRPQQWLQLLRDADYIVTNSFHATLFSVLYHKRFFTVVHGEKDKGINVRMNDFLSYLGLENRIYSSVTDKFDLGEIDYLLADAKIEQTCMKSLAFLQYNLENAYELKNKGV